MAGGIGRDKAKIILKRIADSEQLFKQMLNEALQGRPQTAEEIASAALFLVSDQSSAITGQTLNVDGGMAFY